MSADFIPGKDLNYDSNTENVFLTVGVVIIAAYPESRRAMTLDFRRTVPSSLSLLQNCWSSHLQCLGCPHWTTVVYDFYYAALFILAHAS